MRIAVMGTYSAEQLDAIRRAADRLGVTDVLNIDDISIDQLDDKDMLVVDSVPPKVLPELTVESQVREQMRGRHKVPQDVTGFFHRKGRVKNK